MRRRRTALVLAAVALGWSPLSAHADHAVRRGTPEECSRYVKIAGDYDLIVITPGGDVWYHGPGGPVMLVDCPPYEH